MQRLSLLSRRLHRGGSGEHQDYDRHEGVFGRVVPVNDFHCKKHDAYRACGAWQVGVRFSYLDLNDKAIQGGQVYDWTVGLKTRT
jgi:phosphate-selective porin OprO/OprP